MVKKRWEIRREQASFRKRGVSEKTTAAGLDGRTIIEPLRRAKAVPRGECALSLSSTEAGVWEKESKMLKNDRAEASEA